MDGRINLFVSYFPAKLTGEFELRIFDQSQSKRHHHSKFIQRKAAFQSIARPASIYDVAWGITPISTYGLNMITGFLLAAERSVTVEAVIYPEPLHTLVGFLGEKVFEVYEDGSDRGESFADVFSGAFYFKIGGVGKINVSLSHTDTNCVPADPLDVDVTLGCDQVNDAVGHQVASPYCASTWGLRSEKTQRGVPLFH